MKKEYIIPIFVPHLGCPNDCVFCNQKKISGQIKKVTKSDVKRTINKYLKSFKDNNMDIHVAFYGGSFTAIEPELQEELLGEAYNFIKENKIKSIRVSTRPDYINKEILQRLRKYGVDTIELGVQSSNDYVLEKSKRGHTFDDVKKASKLIRKMGFTLGHQMMIGLPESTKEDEIKTAKDLIKLKPKIVRIYPVLVIKGTELERKYNEGNYEPVSLAQTIEISKELLYLFNKKGIEVIRIGLQNTDTITDPDNEGSEVAAGPYHPAIRQLVESALWYDTIVKEIKKMNAIVKEIEIEANEDNINNIVGHKRENLERLKEFYNLKVKVKANNKIKKGNFKIHIIK